MTTLPDSLIPAALLRQPGKILFIAHLALGDYTYLQNDFQAFKRAHPHLQIDLWIDEVRRTNDASQWPHLQKYALYDWVAACPFFGRVYTRTYSPELYRESIQEARAAHYPVVVSLATLRPHLYAALARDISPDGLVIGMKKSPGLHQLHHHLAYRKLDAAMRPDGGVHTRVQHISEVYAQWFAQLGGPAMDAAQRFPFVDIPPQWLQQARDRLAAWGFRLAGREQQKLVFINPYAKTKKRCWPLDHVAALITAMQQQDAWRDAGFIVNAVPQELDHARTVIGDYRLARTELFSAEDNFFQLPALLAQCNLIVSVETAVMHLANAVHVPVIALMRQKNPEWAPIDTANSVVITAAHRRDWVKAIPVAQVMQVLS